MKLPDFLIDHPDGEIRLTGHRIGLYTVGRHYRDGWSAEQIAEEYPSLPLDLVQKVMAFCRDNPAEVDAYVDAYRAELERQAATFRKGPTLEELRQRWREKGLGALP